MKINKSLFNNKFSIFAIFVLLTVLVVSFSMLGCNNDNKDTRTKVETITVGGNMPDVKAENLGLGDLYEDDIDTLTQYNLETNNKCTAVFTCSTENQSESFSINKYTLSANTTLQDATKNVASKFGVTEFRIGNSEIYLLDGKKIEDGYFVKYDEYNGQNYFTQTCVFLDGLDLYIFNFMYPCTDNKVEGTNLCVDVPANYHVSDNATIYTDLTYKCLYYDEIKEMPSVMYAVIDKAGKSTSQYATEMSKYLSNATQTETVVNNLPCIKISVKQHQKEDSPEIFNSNVYLFDTTNKIVSVAVYELDGAKTYALEAFENCIHSQK